MHVYLVVGSGAKLFPYLNCFEQVCVDVGGLSACGYGWSKCVDVGGTSTVVGEIFAVKKFGDEPYRRNLNK